MIEQARARGKFSLIGLLAVGAALLATHRGEFWPFSIYPMFSRAGRVWQRSLLREDVAYGERWRAQRLESLPGVPCALAEHGVSQIDFTDYVSRTERWDAERVAGLRALLGASLTGHALTVYTVQPGEHGLAGVARPVLQLDDRSRELP